jgi:hypothetical protein
MTYVQRDIVEMLVKPPSRGSSSAELTSSSMISYLSCCALSALEMVLDTSIVERVIRLVDVAEHNGAFLLVSVLTTAPAARTGRCIGQLPNRSTDPPYALCVVVRHIRWTWPLSSRMSTASAVLAMVLLARVLLARHRVTETNLFRRHRYRI